MQYYPHHIGDFDKATRHLTRLERSVYRDLIDLYYENESPISLDLDLVCRKIIARSDEERLAVQQVLSEFFTHTENGWVNIRCEIEIENYRANCSQKAAAGKASAEAKRLKKQQILNGKSTESQQKSTDVQQPLNSVATAGNGISTNQQPTTNNQQPTTKNQNINPQPLSPKSARDDVFKSEFDEVWMLYPPRPGASKAKSLAAYIARRKAGSSAPEIRNGVIAYATYVAVCNTEPQFIKQPETFFGPGLHFQSDWTPPNRAKQTSHMGFDDKDYSAGVLEDGTII